jgi:hypothetical protein
MASPVMTVALPRESGETGKSFGARLRLFMYDTKRPLLSGKEIATVRNDMQMAKIPSFKGGSESGGWRDFAEYLADAGASHGWSLQGTARTQIF